MDDDTGSGEVRVAEKRGGALTRSETEARQAQQIANEESSPERGKKGEAEDENRRIEDEGK